MAVVDSFIKKKSSFGGVSSRFIKPKTADPNQSLDLRTIARGVGLGDEADNILNPKPKLSFLQRLGAGLSAFETGNAAYKAFVEDNVGGAVRQYGSDVLSGLKSAFTGEDVGQTQKKTYRDILQKKGVTNRFAKFGLGLAGDILLDPSTYVGGTVAKGAVKGTKSLTNKTLKTVGKIAPDVEKGLRIAGKGVKDAAGKAFVFGYGTSKGLAEKTLETTSKISAAKEGIVKSNIKRLGTNTLSKTQQDELVSKLLAGKRAEFAGKTGNEALEVARSSDPLVQKTIQSQVDRSQKFAKSAGIDDYYTVYFPGIAKDKLNNFIEGSRRLRVGSEGYRKEFKDLLKDTDMVTNPAEAFARREFEIAKNNIVRSDLNSMVKEFGKPLEAFKTEDEAIKEGYRLIKEKGQFGKNVGYLLESDKRFIDNLISPEFATIDLVAKATGFDAITSLFKRSVTGLFVPFHVRNYASGILQNFEVLGVQALNPKNIATGQKIAYNLAKGRTFGDEALEIAGKNYSLNKLIKPFEKRFGSSSQYVADIGDATKEVMSPGTILSKESFKETAKTVGLGQQSIPFRAARAVGNFIETQQKATAYVTALKQGKTIKEALELATRSGFDYRALTPFESKVLRRLIPFYSFTRKNIELQLRTLGENPQRIDQIMDVVGNLGESITPEEKQNLPDYLKEQFAIKTGISKTGLPEISAGAGTPIEAFGQIFGKNSIQKWASTLNPIVKVPLERAFGKDFFRDRPLEEVIEANEYDKAPGFIKDFLQAEPVKKKNKDGSSRTVWQANPYRLQLLRNLPTSRGFSYVDAAFDETTSSETKLLQSTTGFKPKAIDLETVKYFRDRDRQKELENLLIRAGVLKRFEKAYTPKI